MRTNGKVWAQRECSDLNLNNLTPCNIAFSILLQCFFTGRTPLGYLSSEHGNLSNFQNLADVFELPFHRFVESVIASDRNVSITFFSNSLHRFKVYSSVSFSVSEIMFPLKHRMFVLSVSDLVLNYAWSCLNFDIPLTLSFLRIYSGLRNTTAQSRGVN